MILSLNDTNAIKKNEPKFNWQRADEYQLEAIKIRIGRIAATSFLSIGLLFIVLAVLIGLFIIQERPTENSVSYPDWWLSFQQLVRPWPGLVLFVVAILAVFVTLCVFADKHRRIYKGLSSGKILCSYIKGSDREFYVRMVKRNGRVNYKKYITRKKK